MCLSRRDNARPWAGGGIAWESRLEPVPRRPGIPQAIGKRPVGAIDLFVKVTYSRSQRLGFRLDEETKDLIERAAHLSHSKVSDYCLTALADSARRTIAEYDTLTLSDADRKCFFEALTHPPEPSGRLARALAEHQRRVLP